MATPIELHRFETPDEAAEAAAVRIAAAATDAVTARGRFIWALSGGNTPRLTYKRLAENDMRGRIPWRDTFVLWTDERCVPPDDAGSNYGMARELLLDHVPLPADNIIRVRGERCPLAEDEHYEQAIHRLLGETGRIDLTLLGVGNDGHTASLFPGGATLAERHRWVLPATGPDPYPHRITLTLPLINASRTVIVLAIGAEKRAIVEHVAGKREVPGAAWPILAVRPVDGPPVWLVDSAAFQ